MQFQKSLYFMAILSCSFVACGNQDLQNNLNAAIANDSYQDIESTIKAGAQINFEQASKSPLLKAMLMRKRKAVKALLEFGANPNILYMEKPLIHWALKNGGLEEALLLIKAGGDFSGLIDGELDAFTYVAVKFDFCNPNCKTQLDHDLLNAMMEHGYDVKANFENPNLKNNAWYMTLINNKASRVTYFLGWPDNPYPLLSIANPNQKFDCEDDTSWTPLLKTLDLYCNNPKQNSNVVFELISRADINQKVQISRGWIESPLSYALTKNNPTAIYYIIRHGANIAEAIDLFIANGGDYNCFLKTIWGGNWTLLALAIYYQDKEAVNLLIKKGVYINQVIEPYPMANYQCNDTFGILRGVHTPLFFALHENRGEICDILIEHGAFV